MRRYYPYLEDQTSDNANELSDKRGFLSSIDSFANQKQYVRMTLLNWGERPLKEIQGEISSGSITKDGSSPVRRTCSMSVTFSDGDYDVTNVDMDFSINKKIFIEIGIKNYTDQYPDYPILWFPQGVFFISSASLQNSTTSHPTLSLTLKDKMCGLNGETGGTFPSTVILDTVITQATDGSYTEQKVRIYDILMELVHHYGGEPLENIVIEDVPQRIKQVVRWMGANQLYTRKADASQDVGTGTQETYYQWIAQLEPPDDPYASGWKIWPQGSDVGYQYTDFVYPEELTFNLGDNVCSALDTIKNKLGNYEYFYDVFGTFHFREIKNYLNTTQATSLLEDMKAKDYLADVTTSKASYSFTDKNNIISLTNNPKYENIKNDYVVQGQRKGTDESQSIDVRYHLAIDNKPVPGHTYYGFLLYREDGTNEVKGIFPNDVASESDLPTVGNFNIVYHVLDDNSFLYWDDDKYKDVAIVRYYAPMGADSSSYRTRDEDGNLVDKPNMASTSFGGYTTKDWRTEMYLQGLLTNKLGTDNERYFNNLDFDSIRTDGNYGWFADTYRQSQIMRVDPDFYFEELEAFWPQTYDLENQMFYGEMTNAKVDERKANMDKAKEKSDASYDAYLKAMEKSNAVAKEMDDAQKENQTKAKELAYDKDKLSALADQIGEAIDQVQSYVNLQKQLDETIDATKEQSIDSAKTQEERDAIEYAWAKDYERQGLWFAYGAWYYGDDISGALDPTGRDIPFSSDPARYYYYISPNAPKDLVEKVKEKYGVHDPSTWPTQQQDTEPAVEGPDLSKSTEDLVTRLSTLSSLYGDMSSKADSLMDDIDTFLKSVYVSDKDRADDIKKLVSRVSEFTDIANNQLQAIVQREADPDSMTDDDKAILGNWKDKLQQVVGSLSSDGQDSVVANLNELVDQYSKLADEVARLQPEVDDLNGKSESTVTAYQDAQKELASADSAYRVDEQAYKEAKAEYDSAFGVLHNQALSLTDGNYYLDFIDPQTSGLGEYSVQNIGRRTDAVSDEDVNCLFQPEIPDVVWLEADVEEDELKQMRAECDANGQPWTQVKGDIYQYLWLGGYKNGAFDRIKSELWTHTVYQRTISMTTIPVYYLEPNTRISINDTTTNTYGDYMVNNVSFSLGPGNPMSVSCTECLQKM